MSKRAKIVLWIVLATLPLDAAVAWFLLKDDPWPNGKSDFGMEAPGAFRRSR